MYKLSLVFPELVLSPELPELVLKAPLTVLTLYRRPSLVINKRKSYVLGNSNQSCYVVFDYFKSSMVTGGL